MQAIRETAKYKPWLQDILSGCGAVTGATVFKIASAHGCLAKKGKWNAPDEEA